MNQRFCRLVFSGMLATGLALCAAAAFAQDNSAPPANGSAQGLGGRMGRRGPMSPDQQLAQMTKRYNLSSDQQAKLKPIFEDQQQQMMSMRQDSSLSREDRMAKTESLRAATQTKVEAVLNDQQKQQFEQDQQQMQQRQMNRRGGGGGGADQGGPPPNQ